MSRNIKAIKHRHASDLRTDAANRYVESFESFMDLLEAKNAMPDASDVINRRTMCQQAYFSFLDGWDVAMNIKSPTIGKENDCLHSQILDLTAKLKLKKCERRGGTGINPEIDDLEDPEVNEFDCPRCENGWVPREEI